MNLKVMMTWQMMTLISRTVPRIQFKNQLLLKRKTKFLRGLLTDEKSQNSKETTTGVPTNEVMEEIVNPPEIEDNFTI